MVKQCTLYTLIFFPPPPPPPHLQQSIKTSCLFLRLPAQHHSIWLALCTQKRKHTHKHTANQFDAHHIIISALYHAKHKQMRNFELGLRFTKTSTQLKICVSPLLSFYKSGSGTRCIPEAAAGSLGWRQEICVSKTIFTHKSCGVS